MAYRIEFSRRAVRKLEALPRSAQAALKPVISSLAENPRPSGVQKVKELEGCYRLRKGDLRIVYGVYDDRLLVLMLTVADRKEVYTAREIKAVRQELKERRPAK